MEYLLSVILFAGLGFCAGYLSVYLFVKFLKVTILIIALIITLIIIDENNYAYYILYSLEYLFFMIIFPSLNNAMNKLRLFMGILPFFAGFLFGGIIGFGRS
jgi:uncharacterized membrane protein (Fun14 family)